VVINGLYVDLIIGNAGFKRKVIEELTQLARKVQGVEGVSVPALLQQLNLPSSVASPAAATPPVMQHSVGVKKELDLKALLVHSSSTQLPNVHKGTKDAKKGNSVGNMSATSKPTAQRPPANTNKKPENPKNGHPKKKTDTGDAINMLERMAGANSKKMDTASATKTASAAVEEKKEDVSGMPSGDADSKEAPKVTAASFKDIQVPETETADDE